MCACVCVSTGLSVYTYVYAHEYWDIFKLSPHSGQTTILQLSYSIFLGETIKLAELTFNSDSSPLCHWCVLQFGPQKDITVLRKSAMTPEGTHSWLQRSLKEEQRPIYTCAV